MVEPSSEVAAREETPADRKRRILSEKILTSVAGRIGSTTTLRVLEERFRSLDKFKDGAFLCVALVVVIIRMCTVMVPCSGSRHAVCG